MKQLLFSFKIKWLAFIICMLVAVKTGAQTTPGNPTDTIKKAERIIMVGNSITYGGDWIKLLGRNDVTNWGIPGYTTEQLSWTIKNILPKKPVICFLEGGINDLTLGITPKRVFMNQTKVIDTLLANHIIPIVQSTIYQNHSADNNRRVKKVNQLIRYYCANHQIEYIDLNGVLSSETELKPELTTDGTHLKKEAYLLWAKLVTEMLTKLKI